MTKDELYDFFRLQVDETEDGYWTAPDLLSYAKTSFQRFLSLTQMGLVTETITLGDGTVADAETRHSVSILCVSDNPSGGNSINGQYFILTDTEGLPWFFYYTTTGIVNTAAKIAQRIIYISIAPGAIDTDVAAATQDAITSNAGPFTSVLLGNTVNVTWSIFGYTTGAQNVSVSNGIDTFILTITQQGYNDGYIFNFGMSQEKAMVYTDTDGVTKQLMGIGWEDYQLLTAEQRQLRFVCYLDKKKHKMTLPFTTGTVKMRYYAFPSTEDDLETFLSDVIPVDFHETILKYMLCLGEKRDKNWTLSKQYSDEFEIDCQRAKLEQASRETPSYSESWDISDLNPHRDNCIPNSDGNFRRGSYSWAAR